MGKVSLTVFQDKVLYHALNKIQRNHKDIPANPFNTYYAYCLSESKRLQLEPDWSVLANFPGYNTQSDATLKGEKFDMKKCNNFLKGVRRKSTKKSVSFSKSGQYWKHGQWYSYPDAAIDSESCPCQEDPTWKPRLAQQDPSRLTISPAEELQKAINSGKIDPKGLEFLQAVCSVNAELTNVIDTYLTKDLEVKHDTVLEPQPLPL